jgi:hypothetical protein
LLSHRKHAAASGHVIHPAQLSDYGAEPTGQLARHPAAGQPGHQWPVHVHQPLVCRSGQGRAGQGQEHSPLHPAITTAQNDRHVDGTPVGPRRDEHWVVLRIVGVPVAGAWVRLHTV